MVRSASPGGTLRIAMIGIRGVPAKYGGFETAAEEIGRRLVARGHEVTVYCRGDDRSRSYQGMRRVRLPALRHPVMETLSHSFLSAIHLLFRRADVALVFNAANTAVVPLLRAGGIPTAVHVDGLEWKRAKWGPIGRRYYLINERLATKLAREIIADAAGIRDYYRRTYDTDSVLIAYGAPILTAPRVDRLAELGLDLRGYHLAVARLEPENHLDVIIDGYLRSKATLPLVVVGSVPYASEHERDVKAMAAVSDSVIMLGGVWDQELLDALYAGSASYLHGHHVGGTNPSLLRAMGAAATTVAWDVDFNRDVLGDTGTYFSTPAQLADALETIEADPSAARELADAACTRAAERYTWDDVTDRYERLCHNLHAGVPSTPEVEPAVPVDAPVVVDLTDTPVTVRAS